MPVNAPEPPPGTALAQVRCPKGHPQWVITSKADPIEVNHLICPKCGTNYTIDKRGKQASHPTSIESKSQQFEK